MAKPAKGRYRETSNKFFRFFWGTYNTKTNPKRKPEYAAKDFDPGGILDYIYKIAVSLRYVAEGVSTPYVGDGARVISQLTAWAAREMPAGQRLRLVYEYYPELHVGDPEVAPGGGILPGFRDLKVHRTGQTFLPQVPPFSLDLLNRSAEGKAYTDLVGRKPPEKRDAFGKILPQDVDLGLALVGIQFGILDLMQSPPTIDWLDRAQKKLDDLQKHMVDVSSLPTPPPTPLAEQPADERLREKAERIATGKEKTSLPAAIAGESSAPLALGDPKVNLSSAAAKPFRVAAAWMKGGDAEFFRIWERYSVQHYELARRMAIFSRMCVDLAHTPSVQVPAGEPRVTHGPLETEYSIDADVLRKHKGRLSSIGDEMAPCFRAVLDASPKLAAWFAPLITAGFHDGTVWDLAQTYGHHVFPGEALALGDIAFFAGPGFPQGRGWGVVVSASGAAVTEALVFVLPQYKLHEGSPGDLTLAWRPEPRKLFADHSSFGKFWGPSMSRWRAFAHRQLAMNEKQFFTYVFGGTPYRIESMDQAMKQLASELVPIGPRTRALAGSLLLAPARKRAAVRLSNGRCMTWNLTLENYSTLCSLADLGATHVWYPHRP